MKKQLYILGALFATVALASCNSNKKDDYTLTVAAPTGAPLVASASALSDVELVKITDTALIPTFFVANEKDIIIAPVNVGTMLYNNNQSTYKLASVITFGNLYFASQADGFDEVFDLNDKDVVFFGENTVNQVVVDYVLNQYNVTPKSTTYLGNTKLTQTELLSKSDSIVLIAEPALSAAKKQNSNIKSISVEDLFVEKSGNNKYCQAGCFVKEDTITKHKEAVNGFLKNVKKSCDLASTDAEALADLAISIDDSTPKAVLAASIPGCNISYGKASDIKTMFEFTCNLDLTKFGNKLPDNNFYYNE